MFDIILGERILVIEGTYKGKTGTVVEIHKDDWDEEDHYSVMFDTPAEVTIDFHGASLTFDDHKVFLAKDSIIMPLTELGEALYGDDSQDDG